MSDAPHWFEHGLANPGPEADVVVDGARIHYATWGPAPATAPGVVLIHGSNAHLSWWRFVAPYLARKYRVAALDLSGNGASEHRPAYSGAQLADEVWGVCEAAGLGAARALRGRPQLRWLRGAGDGAPPRRQARRRGLQRLHRAAAGGLRRVGRRAEREGARSRAGCASTTTSTAAVGRFSSTRWPDQPLAGHPAVHRWLAEQSLKEVEGGWTWRFDPALFDHLEMGDRPARQVRHARLPLGRRARRAQRRRRCARAGPYMREITERPAADPHDPGHAPPHDVRRAARADHGVRGADRRLDRRGRPRRDARGLASRRRLERHMRKIRSACSRPPTTRRRRAHAGAAP